MGETDKDDLISIIEEDDPEAVIPTILPMMPVRDVVIFTDMLLPLFVGREKSVNAIEESIAKDRYLFVATQIDPGLKTPKPKRFTRLERSAGFCECSNCRMAASRRWFKESPRPKLSNMCANDPCSA
jgi:ATP-dependent Lon protease